ncbi:MAG: methionyl-tRNA formyltransferase [Candidatus Moraniibacteriota bacterium]
MKKTLDSAKIVFFGTSFFAKEILRNLLNENIKAQTVVTQPDRPTGRKKFLKPTDVKNLAVEKNIQVKEFETIGAEEFQEFQEIQPDLIIVASYGLIIPEEIIKMPKYGCINIHPSLLPQLRGPSPIQTALLQDHKETGVSFMEMNKEVDAGPVFFQKKLKIEKDDIYPTLEKKLIDLTNAFLTKKLEEYLNKEIKAKDQDHRQATLTRLISKKDGQIFWSSSTEEIYNKFRAFYGWPGIYCFWEKEGFLKKISLWEVSYSKEDSQHPPGKVFQNSSGNICIQTGKGAILPLEIQLEGKKSASIADFINGHQDFIGSQLK